MMSDARGAASVANLVPSNKGNREALVETINTDVSPASPPPACFSDTGCYRFRFMFHGRNVRTKRTSSSCRHTFGPSCSNMMDGLLYRVSADSIT